MNVEGMLKQYAMVRKAYGKHVCAALKNEAFSPSEIDILIFLSNNPSINTSKELKVCLGISKSLVCRSVESLMQRGLLETAEDQKDRRIQRLKITEKSYAVIEEIKRNQTKFAEFVMQDISKEEMNMLEKAMNKINRNIEKAVKGEVDYENIK